MKAKRVVKAGRLSIVVEELGVRRPDEEFVRRRAGILQGDSTEDEGMPTMTLSRCGFVRRVSGARSLPPGSSSMDGGW